MPRHARLMSNSGYYHVILRGINKQNIFVDDIDKQKYLNTMFRFADETGDQIEAWCLMSNHVHILIRSDSFPDKVIKKIGCSYVPYFNKKYERVGHLFQDRYKSERVNDENYLIGVVRYIHMNPEKAGICHMERYEWSSYRDYVTGRGMTCTDNILGMLGSVDNFKKAMKVPDDVKYLENTYRLSESEAIAIAKEVIPNNIFYLQSCAKAEREKVVAELFDNGLSASQICRIAGIGKSMAYRIRR